MADITTNKPGWRPSKVAGQRAVSPSMQHHSRQGFGLMLHGSKALDGEGTGRGDRATGSMLARRDPACCPIGHGSPVCLPASRMMSSTGTSIPGKPECIGELAAVKQGGRRKRSLTTAGGRRMAVRGREHGHLGRIWLDKCSTSHSTCCSHHCLYTRNCPNHRDAQHQQGGLHPKPPRYRTGRKPSDS